MFAIMKIYCCFVSPPFQSMLCHFIGHHIFVIGISIGLPRSISYSFIRFRARSTSIHPLSAMDRFLIRSFAQLPTRSVFDPPTFILPQRLARAAAAALPGARAVAPRGGGHVRAVAARARRGARRDWARALGAERRAVQGTRRCVSVCERVWGNIRRMK